RLAAGYPSSKLARQVPDVLLRVNTSAPRAEQAPPLQTRNPNTGAARSEQAPPLQAKNANPADTPPAKTATAGAELARPPAPRSAPARSSTSPSRQRIATIKDIRRSVMADAVRVVIELD